MKRFDFRLEQVLDHRKRLEDQAASAVARAEADCEEARGRLAATAAALESHDADSAGPTDAQTLELRHRRRRHLCQQVEAEQRRVELTEQVLTQQRAAARKASQERQAVSRLEERQRSAHQREWRAREQKSTDEVASSRAARGE